MMTDTFLAYLLTIHLLLFFSVHIYLDIKTKGTSFLKRRGKMGASFVSPYPLTSIVISTLAFWTVFLATPLLIFLNLYDGLSSFFLVDSLRTCLVRATGSFLMFLGIFIADWGRISRGKMAPSTLVLPPDFRFTQEGAYALVRHPMYLSYYLMFTGLFLLTANAILLFCAAGYPSYFYMAQEEERFLEERFEEYAEYKRRVGMFFPKFQ